MADESLINTFTLSVKLPISDASPPDLFFKIHFNCNGIITISDAFASSADALSWAQEELPTFGTWSVSDNTLYLSDCLCGVGSLSLTVTSETQGDATAMAIDDSSPQAISRILGFSVVDVSTNHQRSTDTVWQGEMLLCHWKYADAYADNITGGYHVKPLGGGDGYNILESEVVARGDTLANFLDGVGNETYGYDFFDGEFTAYVPAIAVTEAILSVNLESLLIQVIGTNPVDVGSIDFTDMYAEWNFYISELASVGVTVTSIQLDTELGIGNKSNIVHSANDVKNICVPVIAWFRTNHPTLTIYSDAYQVDDTTNLLPNYNSTLATLDTEGARNYFHFDEDSYEANRLRIYELSNFIVMFRQQFPGKKLRIQQSIVKPTTSIREKVGEGLIYAEWWMNVIKQNIEQSNLITFLTFYNASRLMSGQNVIFPALRFAQLASGMFINDGMIDVTFDNENLEVLGVKKGSGVEIYVINHSSDFQSEDAFTVNNVAKSVTYETYYGDIEADVANHDTGGGTGVLFYPHSLTKIVIA